MKRTYPSGSEKLKIFANKTKRLNSLPNVTSFFGPASVKGLPTTAPAPPSQHASQTTGDAANQNNGNENPSTQTDGDNDDQTLLFDEQAQAPHDDNPTTEIIKNIENNDLFGAKTLFFQFLIVWFVIVWIISTLSCS